MTVKRQLEQALDVRVQSNTGRALENALMLITGSIVGATAMYIFDENSGRRRRAGARNKAVHFLKQAQWASTRKAQDMKNRALGSVMEIRSRVRDESQYPLDDEVLQERVRAQIGHVVSHPGALEIRAERGTVTVSGPVLVGEREKIRTRLNKTRGVQECDLQVIEHASKEGIPGLQGTSRTEKRQLAM